MGVSCSQNLTIASPLEQDVGPFYLPDGAPAGKASRLYLPPTNSTVNDGGSIPGVVMVHGFCAESWLAGVATSAHLVGSFDALDWTCMGPLAEAVAAQGVAVLMVGLHDGDEQLHPELEGIERKEWESSHNDVITTLVERNKNLNFVAAKKGSGQRHGFCSGLTRFSSALERREM